MSKKYIEKNVLDAAIERLEIVFQNFDNIYFSVSGGKDSSVMVQLANIVAKKLNKTTFFNKDLSEEKIIQYTQEAYNILRSQGKTGLNSIEVNGEIIHVCIKADGTFDTAYGIYKYDVKDFR